MSFQKQRRVSRKLNSLPADLRKVADQLIADKFPERNNTFISTHSVDMADGFGESWFMHYINGSWTLEKKTRNIIINTVA